MPNASQDTFSFLCYIGTFLTHVQLVFHEDPQVIFLQSCFPGSTHILGMVPGLVSLQVLASALPFVELT